VGEIRTGKEPVDWLMELKFLKDGMTEQEVSEM
jgi:hypothetical protein